MLYFLGDLSTGDCYAMSANETEECVEMKEGIAGAIGQMGSALAGAIGQEAPKLMKCPCKKDLCNSSPVTRISSILPIIFVVIITNYWK